jgi:hypothetical protein
MARATTAQRGYGIRHQNERARWAPRVDAGLVDCARCGEPLEPGRPWDLGHNDDRSAWTGPEHRACNRKAGGRNGALVTNAMRTKGTRTSRDW